ncbi:hypothetical protein EMCRGX_G025357 [Ephydatia muelleri]
MATNSTKKQNNNGSNLYKGEEDQLNNGHHYHTSNLRYGPQCLNVIQNNLSEEDTSGCSDTDDAEGAPRTSAADAICFAIIAAKNIGARMIITLADLDTSAAR